MTFSKAKYALAAAAVLAAPAAMASTVTFDLQGNDSTSYGSLPSSVTMTEGGITATFDAKSIISPVYSGGIITGGTVQDTSHIGLYPGGAGVVNSTGDNSHTVDGSGYDDFVEITFSEEVEIVSISFGYYDSYDDFVIFTDASGDGDIGLGDAVSSSYPVSSNNPFNGFGGLTTDIFAVAATGSNDSWKLKSITVQYVAPVPLPAAGVMLLAGLGGLGLMRRRANA